MENKQNIYFYVLKLTLVTAIILAGLYNVLEPMRKANANAAKKRAILKCIPVVTDAQKGSVEAVDATFKNNIEAVAVKPDGTVFKTIDEVNNSRKSNTIYKSFANIDLGVEEKLPEEDRVYPLFVYKQDEGNFYVVAVRGNGLWDKIWAYIALEDDLNTVAGVFFDHKGETPGLGAEIKDSEKFKKDFKDRKVFKGNRVAITVQKKGVKEVDYDIAAISGATVTCNGVTEMLHRGIGYYSNYFEQLAKK